MPFILWDTRNDSQYLGTTKKCWSSISGAKNALHGHMYCNYCEWNFSQLYLQSELPTKDLNNEDDFKSFKFSDQTRFIVKEVP